MATLSEIKTRISSVESTRKITKAMKMVSSAKFRRAQAKLLETRPYAAKLSELINDVLPKVEKHDQPLILEREVRRECVVVVAGDRGLCGAFNANVIRSGVKVISELKKDAEVTVFPVGKTAATFFRKNNYDIFDREIQLFSKLEYAHALSISGRIVKAFLAEEFDRVTIVFNEFQSAIAQTLKEEQYLPLVLVESDPEAPIEYDQIEPLYEPSKEVILNALIPKNLEIQMWRVLIESNTAEEAARKVAMESATDNATELIDDLTLIFNRTRQAVITKEIAEIVGGAEALK